MKFFILAKNEKIKSNKKNCFSSLLLFQRYHLIFMSDKILCVLYFIIIIYLKYNFSEQEGKINILSYENKKKPRRKEENYACLFVQDLHQNCII
jgi:hypothetical protein